MGLIGGLAGAPGGEAPSAGTAAAPVATRPPPPNRIFEFEVTEFSRAAYARAAEELITAFEQRRGSALRPGATGRVGLKVYSNSGAGMCTPPDLVRGVIAALARRGFDRRNMFLLDLSSIRLRECGFLPPLSVGGESFDGVPVLALESGRYYDPVWFYDSPLPSRIESAFSPGPTEPALPEGETVTEEERKSFLPMPLLFDLDFWINLPACTDHPVVGVNGALVNVTLWNASNTQRFFRSPATGPAAVAEIAAIPELRAHQVFTIFSLEHYQFIGGPVFNSLYTVSEPLVWLSENPVIIDSYMQTRINDARRAAGFRPLPDDVRLTQYARQLGVGSDEQDETEWIRVSGGHGARRSASE